MNAKKPSPRQVQKKAPATQGGSFMEDKRSTTNAQLQLQAQMQAHTLQKTAQLIGAKEEDKEENPLQGKFEAKPEKTSAGQSQKKFPEQSRRENNTGLPDTLKTGIETLSGYSMDDVKVHYNSPAPAQLQAHAYAQGTDIHVAPGQEQHLPHEAWHVVQQKQGRVQPTQQLKGKVNINDDTGLEKEADVMGGKALEMPSPTIQAASEKKPAKTPRSLQKQTIQRHVLVGAMIKGQDNPQGVDAGEWKNYDYEKVFDKSTHRGDLSEAETGGTFDWNVGALKSNVKSIRNESGFKDENPNFVVVANVNTYKTPGIEDIPASAQQNHLIAFGNGWSLKYNLKPFAKKPVYSDNYNAVLNAWKDLPADPGEKNSEDFDTLGEDGAKQVLRYLTKRYWGANKNFVIPHRGLRNNVLKKINELGLVGELQGELKEKEDSSVSILHLDDDLKVGDPGMIKNMMEAGENKSRETVGKQNSKKRGIAFSAPGYIYEMEDNLLEYAANVLSHIAGRVVKGSYPSEPGLMVTYDNRHKKSVWKDFLLKSPWGEENPDLNELKSYGHKQNKARVESKEGRAFASQYANYLIKKRDAPQSGAAKYKTPIRGKEFVSVKMSSVAKEEIVGKGNPKNIEKLSQSEVLGWITKYIKRNRYHPAGGTSKDAIAFQKKVLPLAAKFVTETIQKYLSNEEEKDIETAQKAILQGFESQEDTWYKQVMEGKETENTLDQFKLEEEESYDELEDEDDYLSHHEWMDEIEEMALNEYNLPLEDLPDQPYMMGYEEGMSAKEFYEEYMAKGKAIGEEISEDEILEDKKNVKNISTTQLPISLEDGGLLTYTTREIRIWTDEVEQGYIIVPSKTIVLCDDLLPYSIFYQAQLVDEKYNGITGKVLKDAVA